MEYTEKVMELRKEILDNIKSIVNDYGTSEGSLDAYGYEVSDGKKVWFVIYNSVIGLRFDTGNGGDNMNYQSAFTIEELANLLDQLNQWYNKQNIKC